MSGHSRRVIYDIVFRCRERWMYTMHMSSPLIISLSQPAGVRTLGCNGGKNTDICSARLSQYSIISDGSSFQTFPASSASGSRTTFTNVKSAPALWAIQRSSFAPLGYLAITVTALPTPANGMNSDHSMKHALSLVRSPGRAITVNTWLK